MSAVSSTSFWRIRHLRFLIAANFCLTALGLSAFRTSENVDASGASGFGNDKAQPVAPAQAKAAPRASKALEKLQPRATTGINSHVARETGHHDVVRAKDRGILTGDNSFGSPEQRALGLMHEHGALIGMGAGTVLNEANNSTGIETINRTVSKAGIYTIKVVNVSVGSVKVWTAATPHVRR